MTRTALLRFPYGSLLLAFFALPLLAARDASADPLRIMPLGDSITVGYTDNRDGWTEPYGFGYRSGLYTRLTDAGYQFQFVGDSGQPWNYTPSPPPTEDQISTEVQDLRDVEQDDHRGYGGAGISYLSSNIAGWLNADDPDLILLMIGINNISAGSSSDPVSVKNGLNNLVNNIFTTKPDVELIVAQITPYAVYTGSIVQYNDYIKNTLVPYWANQGKQISTVDQYSNFLTAGGAIDTSLYSNGINHPDAVGYDRMAQTWFEGIQSDPQVPDAKILDVTMENVVHDAGLPSEYTTRDLVDITIHRGTAGPQTVAVEDMIGIHVSRYRSDTQTVVLAQARGGPDPGHDQRAALLEDLSLNTGFTNVGTGSGLTAPPNASTVGIQVDFDQAVVNGPGADVVIFDMDNGANPVPVVVSRLDADGMGTDSIEVTLAEYTQFGSADLAIQVYQMNTPLSLVDLEYNSATNIAAASNWKTYAAGIDLSDLGYSEGETVGGLFFQSSPNASGWWDPVFIAGMPEVPGGLDGDLNGDGFVGGDDLDIVRSFWGQNVTAGERLSGDPSGDGFVGGDDLDIVRANWGQGTPPAPSAVPEPVAGLLILAGLAAFVATRGPRRRVVGDNKTGN